MVASVIYTCTIPKIDRTFKPKITKSLNPIKTRFIHFIHFHLHLRFCLKTFISKISKIVQLFLKSFPEAPPLTRSLQFPASIFI